MVPPLDHWGSQPPVDLGRIGALRARCYRPLHDGADVQVRMAWTVCRSGERALVRELFQDGQRCIEEHWWQHGGLPESLLAEEASGTSVRLARTTALAVPADDHPVGDVLTALRQALRVALENERRQVASVAVYFGTVPVELAACVVHVGAPTDSQVRFDVRNDGAEPLLRAAARFACGAVPAPVIA
jgi:hypothetical protein